MDPKAVLKALETDDWLEAMVKMVWGDDFGLPVRSLRFLTEKAHPLKVLRAIRLIPDFDGEAIASAIEDLHEGGHLSSVEFGRENTPVLYLWIPAWTNQRSNWIPGDPSRKLTEEEMDISRRLVGQAMVNLGADEVDFYDPETHIVLRAWWD